MKRFHAIMIIALIAVLAVSVAVAGTPTRRYGSRMRPHVFTSHNDTEPSTLATGLGEAVDAPHLTWETGGDSPWFAQTGFTYDGIDAAQSGAIFHNQATWLQTTVAGPCTASFWWCVSSEYGFDYLTFYLDGFTIRRISGTGGGWQQEQQYIPEGNHQLKWEYSKDYSVVSGSDCGWLDQVTIIGAGGGTSLTYQSYSVDGNGLLEGGETAKVNVTLRNSGSYALKGISSVLSSKTPSVVVTAASSLYPDLAGGMASTNLTPFVVAVAAGFAGNAHFEIVSTATNAPGVSFTNTFSVPVVVPPDTYEPDNDRASARYIAPGILQNHSLHSGTDVDYVGFIIGQMAQVTVLTAPRASAPDYNGNTRIGLYAGDGTWLASASTGGTGQYAALQSTLDPGTYYAAIDGDGSGNHVLYDLSIIASPATNFVDDYEEDNAVTSANFAAHGVWYAHSLYPAGDVDFRYFNIAGMQSIVHVEATPVNAGDPVPVLTLYDTNGVTILASGASSILYSNLHVGTYYCRVAAAGSIKKYTMSVAVDTLAGVDGYEPDDSTNQAHDTWSGGEFHHTIVPASDQDWRTFTLGETSDVIIVTQDDGHAPNGDTVLYLYNEHIQQIAMNDDDPYEAGSRYSRIIQQHLPPGSYFSKVVARQGAQQIDGYRWCFEWHATDIGDAYEPDNAASNANPLDNGVVQQHSLHHAADQDWMFFTLTARNDVVVEVVPNGLWGGDALLTLFDANLTQVAYSDDARIGSTWPKIEYGDAPAGRYYVRVTGRDFIHGYDVRYTAAPVRAKVRGRVYGPDGAPITNIGANIAVDLCTRRGGWLQTAYTYADGSYVLYATPGTYTVMAYDEAGIYAPRYYDGASVVDAATLINVPAAGTVSGVDIRLPRAGSILGTVFDATGGPPVDVVHVIGVDLYGNEVGETETDTGGCYRIDGLAPGMCRVYAEGGGYERRWHYAEWGFNQAWPVQVVSATVASNINIVVPRGGAISGSVRGPGGAIIVQGAVQARLFAWNGIGFVLQAAQMITFTGTYAFTGLAPNAYKVSFVDTLTPPVFETAWYNNVTGMTQATVLSLQQGQHITGIDATLRHVAVPVNVRGAIYGVVTTEGGLPLPGATVKRYSTPDMWVTTTTDADGAYAFENVLPGTYTIGFEAQGYAAEFYNNSPSYTGATAVVVRGGDTNICNGQLGLGGTIIGDIYDAYSFSPLVADVGLYDSRMNWVAQADGDDFAFENLMPGTYLLVASAYGYNEARATVTVTSARATVQNVYLTRAPFGYITGTVRDEAGNPVPGAWVTIWDQEWGWLDESPTDNQGVYTAYVPAGYCRLTAESDSPNTEGTYNNGSLVPVTAFEIRSGIDIIVRQRAAIAGRVTYSGAGMKDIWVLALEQGGTTVAGAARTDAQGRYNMIVPHGDYHVAAVDETYHVFAPQYYSGAVSRADAALVHASAGAPVLNIDFALLRGAFIRGRVSTHEHAPCDAAWVTLYDRDGNLFAGDWQYGALSAADGSYALSAPPGTYLVRADFRAFAWQFYSNANAAATATPVTLGSVARTAAADAHNINFWLKPGSTIAGNVYAPDGMPLGNVLVELFEGTNGVAGEPLTEEITDQLGGFECGVPLAANVYTLRARLFNSPYVPTLVYVTVPEASQVHTSIVMETLRVSFEGETTVYATDTLSLVFRSNGSDDFLRFAVTGMPAGAQTHYNAATRTFAWVTRTIDAGCHTCIVTATDGVAQHATLPIQVIVLPAAPEVVVASDGMYPDKVRIVFAPVDRATKYQVYRGTTASTSAMTVISAALSTTDYNDVTVVPGTTYFYAVQAGHNYGWGRLSAVDRGFAMLVIRAGEWKYKEGVKVNKNGVLGGKDVLIGNNVQPALKPYFDQGWQIGLAGVINGALTNWNGPYTLQPNKNGKVLEAKIPDKGKPMVAALKFTVNDKKGDTLTYQLGTNMPKTKAVYLLPTNVTFNANAVLNDQGSNAPMLLFQLEPTNKARKKGWQELKAVVIDTTQ